MEDRRDDEMHRELREILARRTGTDAGDWYVVFKARLGMKAVFETVRRSLGDGAVATTPFTCCTALDPIVAAGLSIRWCDISAASLSLDPASLDAAPDAQASPLRAAVIQHTFGLIDPDGAAIAEALRERGCFIVEDSAHCAGRMATDAQGRPVADVSIHSFGAEKMIRGSYYGGAVWINPAMRDTRLRDALRARLGGLPALDAGLSRKVRNYPTLIRVFNHLPRPVMRGLRGATTKAGLFEPGVTDVERSAGLPYEPQQADELVVSRALPGLRGLDELERVCSATVSTYCAQVERLGVQELVPAVALADPQPLLRFPVILESEQSATKAVQAANAAGFYTVPWYRPLIFPGPLDAAAYGWDERAQAACPVARRMSDGVVALPSDISTTDVQAALDAVLSCR